MTENQPVNVENGEPRYGWEGATIGPEAVPPDSAEKDVLEILNALRIGMSGIGSHADPCRIPDGPCACGVVSARRDARHLIEQAMVEVRFGVLPPGLLDDYDPVPGLVARGVMSDEHESDSCEAECCTPPGTGDPQ